MGLSVVKIAEWSRNNNTDEASILILVDSRNSIFARQSYSGEPGTEYLKRIDLDLANKTGSETVLYSAIDGIAYGGLKIFGKGLTTRRFAGYGMVGGDCDTKGDIIDLDDPSKILCLCDGASNCNLTSNISKLLYDPVSGKILADGGCSGRWIWVIDPSNLSVVGRISESWIRSRSFCNIEIIPRDDEKVFVIPAGNKGQSENYIRIGLVDIEDLIENAGSNPNVDELGSWQELYKDTSLRTGCFNDNYCNGSRIQFTVYDGSNKKAMYDPASNTLTVFDNDIKRHPLWKGWYAVDTGNKQHIIYDEDGSTQLQAISDSDIVKRSVAMWFVLLSDPSNNKEVLKALSPDGTNIPWIEWDFENNKFRVIDFITGNPITMDVILIWSRLQGSISTHDVIPYVANNRVEKVTVSDWTPIPNPPNANVRVLYAIPDLLSKGI